MYLIETNTTEINESSHNDMVFRQIAHYKKHP